MNRNIYQNYYFNIRYAPRIRSKPNIQQFKKLNWNNVNFFNKSSQKKNLNAYQSQTQNPIKQQKKNLLTSDPHIFSSKEEYSKRKKYDKLTIPTYILNISTPAQIFDKQKNSREIKRVLEAKLQANNRKLYIKNIGEHIQNIDMTQIQRLEKKESLKLLLLDAIKKQQEYIPSKILEYTSRKEQSNLVQNLQRSILKKNFSKEHKLKKRSLECDTSKNQLQLFPEIYQMKIKNQPQVSKNKYNKQDSIFQKDRFRYKTEIPHLPVMKKPKPIILQTETINYDQPIEGWK